MQHRITTLDLTPFLRSAVGMDTLLGNMVERMQRDAATNYPPYNILKLDEDKYQIQLAVAGFEMSELDVQINDGELVVSGEHKVNEEQDFVYQGISARRFSRSFTLADHIEVTGAELQNGLLLVSLQRIVPEELKPKRIAISQKKS